MGVNKANELQFSKDIIPARDLLKCQTAASFPVSISWLDCGMEIGNVATLNYHSYM